MEHSFGILECDVQVTADRQLVVLHDERVQGVPARSLTVEDLRALVPTLMTFEEFLDQVEARDPDMRFVIDMKGRDTDLNLAPVMLERKLPGRSLVTSKHASSLRRLARTVPGVRTGLSRGSILTARMPGFIHSILVHVMRVFILSVGLIQIRWSGASYAALQYHLLDRPTVRRLHRFGIRVDAWTVDDPEVARALAENGIDLITSNSPDAIRDDRDDDLL